MINQEALLGFLRREKLATASTRLATLSGDGSDRRFVRIMSEGRPDLLAVLPSLSLPRAMAEARSTYLIGRHLQGRGVPVPAVHAYDEESGTVVFEDLGDCLLQGEIQTRSRAEILARYREAVGALVALQVRGSEGFDPDFCWDTPRYDRQLMRERESGYFLDAFCRDYLGMEAPPAELIGEFERLAARAGEEPAGFLLHRDFQSRNLMIHQGRTRIIDFQGARFGPLGYDLASLLLDPYAALPQELQQELVAHYLAVLASCQPVDRPVFLEGYYYLRLQRNLQIIGAYAFLSHRRGKVFFRQFLEPGLRSLATHLAEPPGAAFPCLRSIAAECLNQVAVRLPD